jgi:hypothetical protein
MPQRQAGVYDCRWGLDTVRVVVARQMPLEARNAPLHLFSASPELIDFGQGAYRRRSEETSLLLKQLFERFREEGFAMSFTMEDFKRQFFKEHFPRLSPEERQEVLRSLPPKELREALQSLPPDELLSALSPEQIRAYLDQRTAGQPPRPGKPRRKK